MYENKFSVKIIVLVFTLTLPLILSAQGKYMRGENWAKFTCEDKDADYFVSPDGNDAWSGTLEKPDISNSDGPFKTIKRAQEAVRELKESVYKPKEIVTFSHYNGSPHPLGDGRDIIVYIRDGYYSLDKPLTFSEADGGERVETNQPTGAWEYHKMKDYSVIYAAYPGENPIISGGRKINNWRKDNDLWIAENVDIEVKKLVVNGKMQTLARTPNSGTFTVPEASESTTEFKFNAGELKQWPEMGQNNIVMYLRWHEGINKLSKIDEANQVAYLEKPQDGIVVISPRYYVENVRALLDTAGEWYFDTNEKQLFYKPTEDITNPNDANIVSPKISELIIVKGKPGKPVRNLKFYGLTFEAINSGSNAVSFEYTSYCELVDSKILGIGGRAVYLGFGTLETRILSNKISQADEGAIHIVGNPFPENWADIIRQNTISLNTIDDVGRNCISVRDALNTTISHNEISNNRGRYPIYIGGWPNLEEALDGGYVVEYNHLHHVQKLSDDSGVITTGGYTHNSIIRRNLIHHVKRGMFNDNVAIWFDNLSYGWKAEDNIYYNLEQGEMKLCAANLVDNIYGDNYKIDAPLIEPKGIIVGNPKFDFGDIDIENKEDKSIPGYSTGEYIEFRSSVLNRGATGVEQAGLFVDGKKIDSKGLAIIENNSKSISFVHRFSEPGKHIVSIGSSNITEIDVSGDYLAFFYDSLLVSSTVLPFGEEFNIGVKVTKINQNGNSTEAILYDGSTAISKKKVSFDSGKEQFVSFNLELNPGLYNLRIGNSRISEVTVYPHEELNIKNIELAEYCASRAKPYKINIDKENSRYHIESSGTDFFHGEDSYASVYIKEKVKGNFVATVKVENYGANTHEWYRTGLFVRNDMTKSFDTGEGSLGSVLMFVSPGRAGMNWDEFGDGCMHKASSQNHHEVEPTPMWIKLVRHGDSFSGYVSYDGKNWGVSRHTENIPGINESIHIGLAAGAPDSEVYSVNFADFQVELEKEDWKGK